VETLVSSPTVFPPPAAKRHGEREVFVRSTALLELESFVYFPREQVRERGWKWRDHDLAQTLTPFWHKGEAQQQKVNSLLGRAKNHVHTNPSLENCVPRNRQTTQLEEREKSSPVTKLLRQKIALCLF
jgi:hypothetical protein